MQILSEENYKERNDETKELAGLEASAFLCNWKLRLCKIRRYRMCLKGLLAICCLIFAVMAGYCLYERIPNVIKLRLGQEDSFQLRIPASGTIVSVSENGESNIPKGVSKINLFQKVTMKLSETSEYAIQVRLFGIIPIKQVELQTIEDVRLYPVGKPIGIYVKTEGVLVVGAGEFRGSNGMRCSPAKNIIKSGDYILKVNGQEVEEKGEVIRMVEESEGMAITLTVKRNNEIMNLRIMPQQDTSGQYKIGVWIRDSAQGVGTMTYVDQQGRFGALGHGINDIDTSTLMHMEGGSLYETDIVDVKRGTMGNPGEITGMIVYSAEHRLGEILENTARGIFGICNAKTLELCEEESLPIGLKQEIKKGPAQILCTLDEATEYYNVEITEIHMDHDNTNRGIELKVTDSRLLEKTGGIVQGMSGSPIIQDGKIIGAVTHVLVQDASRGYGIFIENMLEQSEKINGK